MHKKINENIKINYSNLICSSVLQRTVNLILALHFSHLGNVAFKTGHAAKSFLGNLIICHFALYCPIISQIKGKCIKRNSMTWL